MKQKWTRLWARTYAPFIAQSYLRAFTLGSPFNIVTDKLYVPEGRLQAVYFLRDQFEELLKIFTADVLAQDRKTYAAGYERALDNHLQWALKVTAQDWKEKTDSELIDFVNVFSDKLADFGQLQFLAFLALEGPTKMVEQRIEKEYSGAQAILQSISTPYRQTKLTQARLELLHMVVDGHVSDEDLLVYIHKYAWLPMYEFVDTPLTIDEVKHEMEHIEDARGERAAIEQAQGDQLRVYDQFLSSIEDPSFRDLVEVTHMFAYLKETRDGYRRPYYFAFRPFWHEMASRTKLTARQLNYLIDRELVELLETKDHQKWTDVANSRQKMFSFVMKGGHVDVYDRDISDEFGLPKPKEGNVIVGKGASAGSAIGPVSIVYHRGEFSRFKEGDVLVTTMTHPEFLTVMKKACAIVTDEGGITCHAAIIARELGKPCIIGAGNATSLLKDGDLVEVDGESGIVRKI
ncbi:MAG: hypothetical protein COU35_02485 [Candidatus Magasanikbacteria bacterium CG10_big_fil_rev_8_21_14_0_10_47_10]|uniref:PEP-utilising enzyme mobile domain-containing protein n=1 Tax=Candidatus Magasanikbacteria bacterium CG10_big_fil_rev_8_21_14_0_10_47_10 TaxID=1974652 RepID=A0A2H0TQL3_9BACT|nr:MAG: hypothetical protein COU35_02485 [Candidatus Magasanikbacteria bacterium CG10_big_fil_rev_8_21_14_0_10_47_10]